MGDRRTASNLRTHATPDADPVTVVRADATATGPELHRISWLAAYVVGLASTGRDDQTCVDQLLDIRATTDELRGAHGMLAGWDMQGTERHRRAMQVTEQALATMEPHRSTRRSMPRDHRWVTEWSR